MKLKYIKIFASLNIVFLLMLFCVFNLSAQNFERIVDIPVSQNERILKNAWAGGLNNPQFSNADLNNDGTDDLVIFDRRDDVFLTFIRNSEVGSTDFDYDFSYEKNLPPTESWALLVDYNCDGIKDLFTSKDFKYCSVFTGYYEDDQLKFLPLIDTLYYLNFFNPENGNIPLVIDDFDLPAITDVDEDGDIDILSFNPSGGYLEYYQNQSTQKGYNCDSLIFEMVDGCFGNFKELGIESFVELNSSCGNNVEKRVLHTGSTVLAIDLDADKDKEIMLGDISFQNVNMLVNGGDLQNAIMIEQDSMFPSYNVPAFFFNFPATFYADVNGDGIRDFLASPNSEKNTLNVNCSWMYLNTNEDNAGIFEFQTDKFLVDQMIDVGENSKPVFFDHNGDGLLDLIIANRGYHTINGVVNKLKSTLTLYENTGSADSPSFSFVTADYSRLNETYDTEPNRFYELYPAFGDIDADGDEDMIIGEGDGQLYLFENTAGPNKEATFTLTRPHWQNIDVGLAATPFLFDIDEDGLLDLIIGERNANLNFYRNEGTATEAKFVLVNDFWGGIDVDAPNDITGYSIPYLDYFGEEEELLLVVGSQSGELFAFNNLTENIDSGEFNLITNNFLNLKTGTFSAIARADLDNDGILEVAAGNNRGGLLMLKEDRPVSVIDKYFTEAIKIYPNPANTYISISTAAEIFDSYELMDAMGRVHLSGKFLQNFTLNITGMNDGIYFLKLRNKNKSVVSKIVVSN